MSTKIDEIKSNNFNEIRPPLTTLVPMGPYYCMYFTRAKGIVVWLVPYIYICVLGYHNYTYSKCKPIRVIQHRY